MANLAIRGLPLAISGGGVSLARATATWNGPIGATSDLFGKNPYYGFSFVRGLCWTAFGLFLVSGYGENQATLHRVRESALGTTFAIDLNINTENFKVCSNGPTVFAASNNGGWDQNNSAFVHTYDAQTGAKKPMALGTRVNIRGGKAHSGKEFYDGALFVTQQASPPGNPGGDFSYYPTDFIYGLASQWGENKLVAASRKNRNRIDFADNTTGESRGSLAVNTPEEIAFDDTDGLYVVSDGHVRKYRNTGSNTNPVWQFQYELDGIIDAVAVAVRPWDQVVVVRDGGSLTRGWVEQDKFFTSGGAWLQTKGQMGGNRVSTLITNDTHYSANRESLQSFAYPGGFFEKKSGSITFARNGTGQAYALDAGNYRFQRYDANWNVIGERGWLPDHFKIAADPNNPSVFVSDDTEFEMDWRNPSAGDQSLKENPWWKRKHNWAAGKSPAQFGPLLHVVTYTDENGVSKKFGRCENYAYSQGGALFYAPGQQYPGYMCSLFELPTDGSPLRNTGRLLELGPYNGKNKVIYKEGIRWIESYEINQILNQQGDPVAGTGDTWLKIYQEDWAKQFNAQGNPIFAPARLIAEWPSEPYTPDLTAKKTYTEVIEGVTYIRDYLDINGNIVYHRKETHPFPQGGWGKQPEIPVTEDGYYIVLRNAQAKVGCLHLGAVKEGSTAWEWLALPNKLMRLKSEHADGFWPALGSLSNFGGHEGVGGTAAGKLVVCAYDGQHGHFSNQKFAFSSTGEFLLQFGRDLTAAPDFTDPDQAPEGYANNTGYDCLVQVALNRYMYRNTDETLHGGPHEWDIILRGDEQPLP